MFIIHRLTYIGLLSSLLGQLAVASPSTNQPLADKLNITVTSISGTGSGCPRGIGATTSPDRSTLTLYSDEFNLYYGPNMSPMDKSKNCNILVKLSYPTGYTFGVVAVTYSALSRLEPELSAGILSTYITKSGPVDGATVSQTWRYNGTGVADDRVIRDFTIPESSRVLTACGEDKAELRINTRVSLQSSSSKVWGTIDDGPGFTLQIQQIHLGWAACKG